MHVNDLFVLLEQLFALFVMDVGVTVTMGIFREQSVQY